MNRSFLRSSSSPSGIAAAQLQPQPSDRQWLHVYPELSTHIQVLHTEHLIAGCCSYQGAAQRQAAINAAPALMVPSPLQAENRETELSSAPSLFFFVVVLFFVFWELGINARPLRKSNWKYTDAQGSLRLRRDWSRLEIYTSLTNATQTAYQNEQMNKEKSMPKTTSLKGKGRNQTSWIITADLNI